jgi:hypothetical protein
LTVLSLADDWSTFICWFDSCISSVHDVFLFFFHFFPHDQRKSHYNAGSWGEYANGPVTKAQVKANKLTKAGLVQLLSTPHYDKKKWKKHERGNIFAEDYVLWFWCLQNMFSSTVQPRKHQEMRFVADQTCCPRSKCWPRERVDTRWPGEPCSMFS